MPSLNISDKLAEILSARATAAGVSIDEVLLQMVSSGSVNGGMACSGSVGSGSVGNESAGSAPPIPTIAPAELDLLIDRELTEAPLLPSDFSRLDIYADHD